MLAALEAVDYVTIFGEATPHAVLARLKPDLLVKGGTYADARNRRTRAGRVLRRTGESPGEGPRRLDDARSGTASRIEGSLIGRRDENRPLSSELDRRRRDGDAALRALRKRFAQAEMVSLHRPYVSDALAGLDLVDRSIAP